jgi:hypothetical protein
LVVHCTPDALRHATAFNALIHLGSSVAKGPKAARTRPTAAQCTQPLEPILFPKLRIYFADFPYLHCSIN